MEKFMVCLTVGFLCLHLSECKKYTVQYSEINCRTHVKSLTDFGGHPDGKTSNTAIFQNAINQLGKCALKGGAMLVVPAGWWLTGSFNLTSHFTLYLDKGAVILASQDESEYPLVKPLPSYGRGRDNAIGPRFGSLISGTNLTDVVITGANGAIDGQGQTWWTKFRSKTLKYTRPYLIELISSNNVQISNLTLANSPSWHVHPVYCDNVIIESLTILAPVTSPNTDGINPDSCTNTRIWNSKIVSGDDCIAVKSGWDEYGIAFARPTQNLSIKGITCNSPDSATIALGSEMSGGIEDVRAENIYALDTESALRVKTAPGRGGYVKDIFVKNMILGTMKYVLWMSGKYGQHADNGFDPNALPNVTNLNFRDIVAENVTLVGNISGIEGDPFTDICISNLTATMAGGEKKTSKINEVEMEDEMKIKKKVAWVCSDITGYWSKVQPKPCYELKQTKRDCPFPSETEKLDIEKIELLQCQNHLSI